ncbi:MAG TPA: hypothetical protein DG753_12125 [Clostridium sp.]|nr:hypothetical protein [Clostridium sp.]
MMSSINGCFSSKQKPYTLKANMLKFVNEKYNMEFIPTYFAMDKGSAHLIVYPKGGDREKDSFKVIRQKNRDTGEYEIKDTYTAIMMAPKYKAKLEELLKPYFENYLVEVRADMCVLPNDFVVDDDFQEVLDKKVKYVPHVDIRVTRSSDTVDDFNRKVDEFYNSVSENHVSGHILVVYLKNKEVNREIMANDEEYDGRKYLTIEN